MKRNPVPKTPLCLNIPYPIFQELNQVIKTKQTTKTRYILESIQLRLQQEKQKPQFNPFGPTPHQTNQNDFDYPPEFQVSYND
jgi:hypothetical protein